MAIRRPQRESGKPPGRFCNSHFYYCRLAQPGYAAYLFIDPKPGPTLDDKLEEVFRVLLKAAIIPMPRWNVSVRCSPLRNS